MLRRAPLTLLAVLLFGLGCDDEETTATRYEPGSLAVVEEFPGEPGPPEAHASLFAADPYADQACNAEGTDLGLRRELRIFVGPGVRDVARYTRGLQRWFRRHGVTFYTRHAPLPLPIDWALNLDDEALQAHLKAKFPEVDFASPDPPDEATLEAIQRAVVRFLLAPVVDFAEVYGREGQHVTNLVLLPRVRRDEVLDGTQEQLILGLALSPTLIRSFQAGGGLDGEATLWEASPFEAEFTPMMFINAGLLARLADRLGDNIIDLTMAHELGHTLGLHHVARRGNLMSAGIEGPEDLACTVGLEGDQIEVAAGTLSTDQRALALRAAPLGEGRWRFVQDRLRGAPLPGFHRAER